VQALPDSLLTIAAILSIVPSLLLAVPSAMILARVGHSPWWALLVFVPLVNFVALWVFAFGRWPASTPRT